MTNLRVYMSNLAKSQDVADIDRRVIHLENQLQHLRDEAFNRRDFNKWIWPMAISLAGTLAVLGLKLWEVWAR